MTSGLAHRTKCVAVLLTLLAVAAQAYGQANACPGFKNPTSFVTGNPRYFWSARVGERVRPSHATDTTTGYYVMSTCTNAPEITGTDITSPSYNSGPSPFLSGCNETYFDANDKRFQIITQANAGIDQFTVTNPGTGMQRIPPGYMTSIRLGDMCNAGGCSLSHDYDNLAANKSAEALFYTMYVTSANALLIINYAVVARRFSHTAYDAGEFLIRVVGQNDDSTWSNAPINDSLWYKVSAPTFSDEEMPAGWLVGANHGPWPCTYAYKPWTSVAISLNNYLYHNVRVEMYTSDCIYNADPIYAYICGDFRPMTLTTAGCPSPESDVVNTLSAPPGMISYKWYVTTRGSEPNVFNTQHMDSVPFRALTGEDTLNTYSPVVSDFVLTEGSNAGDTVEEQTFMCIMTSALDPHKPMHSKLYANVTLQRPIIDYSLENRCDTTVLFHNLSRSIGGDGLLDDSTYWVLYSDTTFSTVLDTLWANDTSYRFSQPGYYGVKLYGMTARDHCMANKKFVCNAIGSSELDFLVNKPQLCEGEELITECTIGCEFDKHWYIDGQQVGDGDTLRQTLDVGSHNITLEAVISHGCTSTVKKIVHVLGKPILRIGSEKPQICLGDSVVIEAEGNVAYKWSSSPHDNSLPDGYVGLSATVRPTRTTTYTLKPATSNPCYNDNTFVTIDVIPYPTLRVGTDRNTLSLDNNTLAMTDLSPNHTYTLWSFDDGTTAEGEHHVHTYEGIMDLDSVCVWMTSCNGTHCCMDTSFCLPVSTFSIWFPNAFTPSLEENNRFKAVSSIEPTDYEIAIYNRQGLLIHVSHDVTEGWDGTDRHGNPCPQGAYAYHYRYAKDNSGTHYEGRGTVTLIR